MAVSNAREKYPALHLPVAQLHCGPRIALFALFSAPGDVRFSAGTARRRWSLATA
jgi:hypothetical protein